YSDPTSPTTTWYAPKWEDSNFSRSYKLVARVSDEQGYSAWDTLSVLVYSEAGTIWVVDSEYATVKKYTAEGDFVLASDHNFTEPRAVASDVKRDYGCYVADYGADEVIKLNHLGEFKARYPNLPNVTDVALHEPSHTLWAINEGDGTLAVFYNHTPDVPAKTVSGFHSPNAITINQSSGDVWVADVGNNTVVQLNAVFLNDLPSDLSSGNVTIFGDTSATYNFNVPAWLSVRDQVGGTLYIADNKHGEVERLTYNSSSETYFRDTAVSGFETPSRVVATRKGEVWVLSDAGTIQYFDEDNVTLAPTAIFSYTFVDPHAMAADDNTGDVWVGDNGTHQIVRIVSPDSLAATISGINYVADIVVNR
ncbi:MAG: hypothetical protein KAU50_01665, partial [Candidatus Marinimicrobia bacterium]|nr:hypothetical protein [Candidatus Neomarinimicrobiota bacterium]